MAKAVKRTVVSAVKRTVMSPDYMVKAWATRSGNDSEDDDSALFGERAGRGSDDMVEVWAMRSGDESEDGAAALFGDRECSVWPPHSLAHTPEAVISSGQLSSTPNEI